MDKIIETAYEQCIHEKREKKKRKTSCQLHINVHAVDSRQKGLPGSAFSFKLGKLRKSLTPDKSIPEYLAVITNVINVVGRVCSLFNLVLVRKQLQRSHQQEGAREAFIDFLNLLEDSISGWHLKEKIDSGWTRRLE
jgi:hypothetical protein